MKLYLNEELRREITKKIIMALPSYKKEELSDFEVNHLVDNVMNDKEKLELHKKALEIQALKNKQNEVLCNLKEEYESITGRQMELKGMSRIAYMNMDVSGTPEAKKKNMEYIISLQDPNFAKKEFGKIVNLIRNFDYSKTVFKKPSDAVDLLKENYHILSYMFVVMDPVNNSKISFGPKADAYIKNTYSAIQQGGLAQNMNNLFSSNLYITTPNGCAEDLYNSIEKICSFMGSYKDKIDGVETVGNSIVDKKTSEAIADYYNVNQIMNNEIANQPELFEKDILHKDLLKNYVAKKNGKEVEMNLYIKSICQGKNDISLEKRPLEEVKELDELFGNPALSKIDVRETKEYLLNEFNVKKENTLKKYTLVENTFESLKQYRDALKDANHFYSIKHAEYTNLVNKLDTVLNKEANLYSVDEFTTEVKAIKELSDAYVVAKIDQTKNSTRQKRYDISKNISLLAEGYTKAMNELNRTPYYDSSIEDIEKLTGDDMEKGFNLKELPEYENEMDLVNSK